MASLSPRLWSDRDLQQKYILMDEDREADHEVSSISIVADPDRTNKDEEDTLNDIDDDDDDESTSPFSDLSLKEVISIDETGASLRAPLTRREKLMRIINSIWWQAVVVFLIVVDVVLLGLQLYGFYGKSEGAKNMEKRFDDNEPLTNLSISIVVILLAELIVMVVSFIIMLVVVNHFAHSILVLLRIIRVAARLVRIVIKVWQGKKNINQAVRTVVTENKQRYTKDGWDLDLAYVTDRIIVSSLPAYNFQSLYRNHDVVRFLDTKHFDSYLVVNCCAERYADYPISKFHDRVKRYYIEDHNTGTLSQLLEACEHMQRWQDENPKNIVFVHCKGGKGRSGSVICTFMLYSGICSNADEALDLFANKRTDPTKPGRLQGVETASQRRYVDYFSTIVNNGKVLPSSVSLSITKLSVRLISPDNLQNLYQLAPFASVTLSGVILKRRDKYESYDTNEMSAEYEGPGIVAMNDVRLMVFLEEKTPNKKTGKRREIYFFYFWFHTAFVTHVYPLVLSKHEVDRNRKWKRSPFAKLKSLSIEVHFTPV